MEEQLTPQGIQTDVKNHRHNGVDFPRVSQFDLDNRNIPIVKTLVSAVTSFTPRPTEYDQLKFTALANALLFNNPDGVFQEGQKLLIVIKDDGSARALTYQSKYRSTNWTLPSTTTAGKCMYMGFIRNQIEDKWDLVTVVIVA